MSFATVVDVAFGLNVTSKLAGEKSADRSTSTGVCVPCTTLYVTRSPVWKVFPGRYSEPSGWTAVAGLNVTGDVLYPSIKVPVGVSVGDFEPAGAGVAVSGTM